MVNGISDPKF